MNRKTVGHRLQNLPPAVRGKVICAINNQRSEHYGIKLPDEEAGVVMQNIHKYFRSEISDKEAAALFGVDFEVLAWIKPEWIKHEILKLDPDVVDNMIFTIYGIIKKHPGNPPAQKHEADFIGYGMKEAFTPFLRRKSAAPKRAAALPRLEDVWAAVAKSIKDNKKKGMMRQAAIEKAIADNIADITPLGLWRANKGRPNEGAPGSSWRACYQTLYDKGYLKQ